SGERGWVRCAGVGAPGREKSLKSPPGRATPAANAPTIGARPMKLASHEKKKQNASPAARSTPLAWSFDAIENRRGERYTPATSDPTRKMVAFARIAPMPA